MASNGPLHDHEELRASCRLNDPTTGDDLFSKVQETLTWDLAGKELTSLTASGGRNVCGPDILRTNVRGITRAGCESPMLLPCFIQGALCCNFFSVDINEFMKTVIITVPTFDSMCCTTARSDFL